MEKSLEESQICPKKSVEEVPFPLLNLRLTKPPEFISMIEPSIIENLPHLTDYIETLTPNETPKTTEKLKALNFPISKITIGGWTCTAVYPDDLMAKFYFAKKKLIWEFLYDVEMETRVAKLKRKIEIPWSDVLSFKPTYDSHDETELLEVELSNRPTFFIEINPQAGKHTQWKPVDQDFTQDQYASKCRRHTLHFAAGVLQKNLEKLLSTNSFWSELIKVKFPFLADPFFNSGYENNNNNLSHYSDDQTLRFNVNNDLLHRYSQGVGNVGTGEVNVNMGNQYCVNDGLSSQGFDHVGVGGVNFNVPSQYYPNDRGQMSSFVQDNLHNNIANQLHGTQVIQPSYQPINKHYDTGRSFSEPQLNNPMIQDDSQMRNIGELHGTQVIQPLSQPINEHYEIGRYFREPQLNNPMIQDGRQMINTGELLGSQAYAQGLLETQTNSMTYPQHRNDLSVNPEIGPYLQSYLDQEGETHNMEHTHLDGNFQTNMMSSNQFGNHDHY